MSKIQTFVLVWAVSSIALPTVLSASQQALGALPWTARLNGQAVGDRDKTGTVWGLQNEAGSQTQSGIWFMSPGSLVTESLEFSPPWQGGLGGTSESRPQSGKHANSGDRGIDDSSGIVPSRMTPPTPPCQGGEASGKPFASHKRQKAWCPSFGSGARFFS